MGARGARDRGVRKPGQLHVVGEAALAADETEILRAANGYGQRPRQASTKSFARRATSVAGKPGL